MHYIKRGTLFSRRPANKFTERMQFNVAIVLANDQTWKEQRTMVLNSFRDLCFRKTGLNLEYRINDELAYFVKELVAMEGDADIADIVTLSFANVIYSVLHGRRIGYSDVKFQWYLNILEESFKRFVTTQTLHYCCPFLHYLPGDFLKERYVRYQQQQLAKYFEEICGVNFENYEEGDENCFLDFWIAAGKTNNAFRKENVWITLHDLMAAGSETTATTLKWIVLALVKFPNIQRKLQKQVDSVLGTDQAPSIADRESLPYVEATILEGLRFGTPVPLSVPHAVSQDTVFKGFLIPKEATILPNIASVHYDSAIFPDPETFRPERFLNEDETKIIGTEKLIPFSFGPRSCIGETLARTELLLYLTTLVQSVEFYPPEKEPLPSMQGKFGLTYRPKKFKVKIVNRKEQTMIRDTRSGPHTAH